MPDSAALVYAYDRIVEGVGMTTETITVYNGTDPLSKEALSTVIDAYTRDHTEQFWFGTTYYYSFTSSTVTTVTPTYTMTGPALAAAKNLFTEKAEELLALVDPSMSDLEKEITLHRALAERVTYAEEKNAHSSYGAIVDGLAVCEGYAEALQYLLRCVGIQSFIALGSSVNPSTLAEEPHAWNYVKIDGKFYNVDLTWNDQGSNLYHAYFNVTDERMKEDHNFSDASYPLPQCISTDLNYFKVYGGLVEGDAFSEDNIADRLKKNGLKASFYITGDPTAFWSYFKTNVNSIATKAGVSGAFTYSYSKLGREMIVEIRPNCLHLSKTKIEAEAATCDKKGVMEYYRCDACDGIFKTALSVTEIADFNTLTIPALGHKYEKKTETADYMRRFGTCSTASEYYYACSVCDLSAGKDPNAVDKYYSGSTFAPHSVSATLSSDGQHHFKKCTNEGCTYREAVEECHGGTATCSTKAKCSVCGNDYGNTAEHKFDTGAYGYSSIDGHGHLCTECGGVSTLAAHVYPEEGGGCIECGYEMPTNPIYLLLEKIGVPREMQKTVAIAAFSTLGLIVLIAIISKIRR